MAALQIVVGVYHVTPAVFLVLGSTCLEGLGFWTIFHLGCLPLDTFQFFDILLKMVPRLGHNAPGELQPEQIRVALLLPVIWIPCFSPCSLALALALFAAISRSLVCSLLRHLHPSDKSYC